LIYPANIIDIRYELGMNSALPEPAKFRVFTDGCRGALRPGHVVAKPAESCERRVNSAQLALGPNNHNADVVNNCREGKGMLDRRAER
jgi:hypothetical protein